MSARPVPEPALALIRQWEGLRLAAYRDAVRVATIGYGHTGPVGGQPLRLGMRIDRATAEELLAEDAQEVADKIAAAAQVPLTDGQFGALTSFAFNLGWGALRGSTLWRLVQAGDMRGAAGQFGRWTKAGRPLRVLPGLVKRRAAERALFAGA